VVIRTPDQRLRVFVTSTLGELADERRAVTRAVSALRLTPVLFDLGRGHIRRGSRIGPIWRKAMCSSGCDFRRVDSDYCPLPIRAGRWTL